MNLERYKQDLEKLVIQGGRLYVALLIEVVPDATKGNAIAKEDLDALPNVRGQYQAWYSEAIALIRQLMPDRLDDFISYYKPLKATQRAQMVVRFSAAVSPLGQQVNISQGT
jgi:hypothetical protein